MSTFEPELAFEQAAARQGWDFSEMTLASNLQAEGASLGPHFHQHHFHSSHEQLKVIHGQTVKSASVCRMCNASTPRYRGHLREIIAYALLA